MLRLPTAALLGIGAVASAAALATAGSQPPGAERAFTSKCGVFPAADVAATAASLPDQRAWNQDISAAPVDPGSDAIIDYINGSGGDALHPDFGSPREYGIPYKVVGKRTKAVRVKFTAYGDESDKGKYRVPLGSPVEGGKNADGDRHVIAYDKARCELFELYRAFRTSSASAGRPTRARSGTCARRRPAARRLDLGRRRRPAGLRGARPPRRGRPWQRRPRDPGHLRLDPATAGSTRPRTAPATPASADRAADGDAAAPQGRLRHLGDRRRRQA